MDLETFIAETLRQIVKGVKTAQQSEDCKGSYINPCGTVVTMKGDFHSSTPPKARNIEFDVAVTAVEGTEKKSGIGVVTGVFGIGGQAASNVTNSSVSRIKFDVPVILPATPSPQEK